jgi:branched-chain amino acid transport system permease protein
MNAFLDFFSSFQGTAAFALVNAVLALSTYVVLGCGVLSFATVSYAAVGGFIGSRLLLQTGVDPWMAIVAAMLAGALLSWLIAAIFLRLESHWMALATLALVLITRVIVVNVPALTGGVNGIALPTNISLGWLAIICALVMFTFWRLSTSWFGIASRAVREDPAVASSIGIPPRRIQTIAFVISGAVGGLGGVLMAMTLQFISPDTYFINVAFTVVASVVLGGSYHWLGAVVGAAVFTALPILAQSVIPSLQDAANGVVLLLIMLFLPRGLIDPDARLRRRAQKSSEVATS